MTRRNVMLWLGIALAALLVNLAILMAPEVGVPRMVFIPIILAGLFGIYLFGVRKAKAASLRSRVLCGVLWTSPWMLLLCLPWGLLMGGYAWERFVPIVPPDAVLHPSGFMLIGEGGGFQYATSSNLPWSDIERHYTERLTRRGWRHEWTRDFREPPQGAPPGAPLPRWILYRRFDGLMLVCVGALPNGQTFIIPEYLFLRQRFDADHLLRD